MPRDQCRDCEQPVSDLPPEQDNRCTPCHVAFVERQAAIEKKPRRPPEPAEEE